MNYQALLEAAQPLSAEAFAKLISASTELCGVGISNRITRKMTEQFIEPLHWGGNNSGTFLKFKRAN